MEKEKKIELLAEILDVEPEELSEEMNLADAGDWDSLAILSFIMMLGDEFNKEIGTEQAKKLVTVADALAIME